MIFLLPDDKGLSISSNMLSRSPGFPQLMPSINSTPGVVEVGSGLSSKGSSIRSNLYYYQDVNITDPYEGTNIINLKFPETSVVSISSLGKSVKNQATGTSINITSETSSDKLSFSTTFNYLRDLFKSDFQSGETSLTSEMQDVSLQIGGPIGDDRFWVQGSYLRSSFDHTNQIEALTPAHDSSICLQPG